MKKVCIPVLVLFACVFMGIVDAVIQPGYIAKSGIKILLFLLIPVLYSLLSKDYSIFKVLKADKKGILFAVFLGVIIYGVIQQHGLTGLLIATIMAGIMLILMGICRFGALIKYIPYTITTGFTSGIALTIVIGQIKDFLGLTYPEGTHAIETMEKVSAVAKSIGTLNWQALLVGLLGQRGDLPTGIAF